MRTYTFHVSPPGFGRVWRKLELPSEFTLEDLHFAIQDAFEFDQDHLYSFFMSGKAWDASTEYALPEGADPWGFDIQDAIEEDEEGAEAEEDEDKEDDEMLPDLNEEGEELPEPTPEELREMFDALKADPALMAEAKKQITQQLGIPGFLFDMIVNNSDMVMQMAGDLPAFDDAAFDAPLAGDVRETTLEALGLKKGKAFLYLFDYGDEWRFKVRVSAVNEDADPGLEYPLLVESVGEAPAQYGEWEDEEEDGDEE